VASGYKKVYYSGGRKIMEQEQLFTAAKWGILEALSKRNMSPLELSAYVDSSLANISQSLRMLELAGIVKTDPVGSSLEFPAET